METFVVTAVIGAWKVAATFWIRNQMLKRFEYVGKVSELHFYPIKACKSNPVESAFCSIRGLIVGSVSDRSIMIVKMEDGVGHFQAMSHHPTLSLIRVSVNDNDQEMTLTAPNMEPLTLPLRPRGNAARFNCIVNKDMVTGQDYGEEAADWFCRYLQSRNIRLVYYCDNNTRSAWNIIKPWPRQTTPEDMIAFTNLSAYLVTNRRSLEELNRRLEKPINIMNFRPNIVVDANRPFEEDEWTAIRIGERVMFRCIDNCRRCVITTVNPDTGVKDTKGDPLTTLRTFRKKEGYGDVPCFGKYNAVDMEGYISVGDPVFVLRR